MLNFKLTIHAHQRSQGINWEGIFAMAITKEGSVS